MKFVFAPISIVLGLIAGAIGGKIFERIWGLVDEEEPPKPEHREFSSRQPHLLREADRLLAGRGGT